MRNSSRLAILAALTALLLGAFVLSRGEDAPRGETQARPVTPPPAATPVPSPGPSGAQDSPPVPDTRLAALGGRGPLIGLADNRPETLADPRFQAAGIKRVRVAVPYDDVALGGERLAIQDAWFAAAQAQGIEPTVSFFRSSRGRRILPTEDEFRRDFQLFRQRYPRVRYFSTWNEANFTAQPTAADPVRTAHFYRIARQECSGGRCNVIACDFRPDGTRRSARWLEAFQREIGPGPHTWGLSSYVDVNGRSTRLTRAFLRHTTGPVWVNEVGAINFFGRGLAPDQERQTRVMGFLMNQYPRISQRIGRIYVYHWRAAAGDTLFDSGLVDVEDRPRPAYYVFFQAIGVPAP